MSEFSPELPRKSSRTERKTSCINKALNDDVVRARASEPRFLFFLLLGALKIQFNIEKMQIPRIALTHRDIGSRNLGTDSDG